MEIEEIEVVMEKIWDLHDKLSDAIHSISRAHYLNSIKSLGKAHEAFAPPRSFRKKRPFAADDLADESHRNGFVFVKGFRAAEDDEESAIQEAKSLNAIRTALENLEDQLEFFHTVQTQQRAERDAAIARLEQSRIVLAVRLAEHQGKRYKVIEEAQAFVGNVGDATCFVSPGNLYVTSQFPSSENFASQKGKRMTNFVKVLVSGFHFAQKTLKLDQMGGILGNAALIVIGMLALHQLHQAGSRDAASDCRKQDGITYNQNVKRITKSDASFNGSFTKLDVMLARG